MRLSGVDHLRNFDVNFGKVDNNATPVCKESNNVNENIVKGLDALTFMGINAQCEINRPMPNELKSTIDEFYTLSETANSLAEDAQKGVNAFKENVQKQSETEYKDAQKIHSDIMALFDNGDELASNKVIYSKIKQNGNTRIIEEFDEQGKIKRLSMLNGKTLKVQEGIKELNDGTLKIAKEMKFENGELREYIKGYEESLDGTKKTEQEMRFYDGHLSFCRENHEKHPDGYEKTQKEISLGLDDSYNYTQGKELFTDGAESIEVKCAKRNNVVFYAQNYKAAANKSVKIGKELCMENGQLSWYTENNESYLGGSSKTSKKISLQNGKPEKYEEGCRQFANGNWKRAKLVYFTNGEPIYFANGSGKSLKEYEPTNGSWQEIIK